MRKLLIALIILQAENIRLDIKIRALYQAIETQDKKIEYLTDPETITNRIFEWYERDWDK